MTQGSLVLQAQDQEILDSRQLDELERCFRNWAGENASKSRQQSRCRILLIFLLIRYTGAKLNEVLSLEPSVDIDIQSRTIRFRSGENDQTRQTTISQNLAEEVEALLDQVKNDSGQFFAIDPAYVRKKFYERAELCGFKKKSGGPEMLRKARAVEMLHNVPLPAVQHLLGHSSPNQTTAFVSFSEEDLRKVAGLYMERESGRRTSARNSFYGKVLSLKSNEIQSLVELVTPGGDKIMALITNTSSERLGLVVGKLIVAEVKSPWLIVEHSERTGETSAENQLLGTVSRATPGGINVECVVTLKDGTELCAVLTAKGYSRLQVTVGDSVRVLFGAYAVILHAYHTTVL